MGKMIFFTTSPICLFGKLCYTVQVEIYQSGCSFYVRYHCPDNRHYSYGSCHFFVSATNAEKNCNVSVCFVDFIQHPFLYDWCRYRGHLKRHRHCACCDFCQTGYKSLGCPSHLDLCFLCHFCRGLRFEFHGVGHHACSKELLFRSPSGDRYGCYHHRFPDEEGRPRADFRPDQFPLVAGL